MKKSMVVKMMIFVMGLAFMMHGVASGESSLKSTEKAVRPDAIAAGDIFFGPRSSCSSSMSCCSGSDEAVCSMTPIFDVGFIQVLTASGPYCLASDLSSGLIIAGSSITIYMNGHAIFPSLGTSGITIQGNVVDVRIVGGAIDGQLLGSNTGVFVMNAADVRLEGITCVGCQTGIQLSNGTVNAWLSQVSCSGNGTGLFGQNDMSTTVIDSVFNENGMGVSANGSSSLVMQGCQAHLNSSLDGFSLENVEGAELINCLANKNFASGFFVSDSSDLILRDCYASNNSEDGFEIGTDNTDVSLFNCVAQLNTLDGFLSQDSSVVFIECVSTDNDADGFNFLTSEILVRNSVATGNANVGFETDDVDNQFYSNVACNNGTNYGANVISAPVTSPFNMRGVQNVDCNDTTPDAVDIILGEVSNAGGCDVTILSVDAPITLTAAGRYCLAVDFTNTITINGISITLDLNGHTINAVMGIVGVDVAGGSEDVRIKNGFITGDAVTSASGIVVSNAADVRIENIVCEGFVNSGIFLNGAQRAFISGVNCNLNAVGIAPSNDSDTVIVNSSCGNNLNSGIFFSGSQRFSAENCTVNGNNVGIQVDTCSNSEIANCVMSGNATHGITFTNSSNFVVRSSSAQGLSGGSGGAGFLVTTGTNICFFNCTATLFDVGFGIDANSNTVLTRECSSNGNGSYGFLNQSATPCFFYANDACNNPTNNYSGVASGAVVGASTALYWQNVDCML